MLRRVLLVPLIVLGAAALAPGCASSEPAAPPLPIQARVSGIFPKTSALTTSVLEVKVEILNPRATPVGVESVRYALETGEVAGTREGSVPADATLQSEQQAELGFEIEIPIPGDRLEELAARDMVPADLSGEVVFADGTTAAFERKAGLAIPRLPSFVVFDAQAAQYERRGVDVTFFLRLLNENPFTLPIQAVEYELEVAGKTMRTEQAGVGTRLTPGAAEEYEVPVRLDDSTVDDLQALEASGEIAYRVKGQVLTRAATVPFDHEGTIELAGSD